MYCPYGHSLCRTLQGQSRQVWNDLQDAETLGVPYHENTITQLLALHLNRFHPRENQVYIFDQNTEGRNGSDFLWLFFDRNLSLYFPVAVQAKRLYPCGRYKAFKSDQVGKIKRYAHKIDGQAIYLTYNYPCVSSSLWKVWVNLRPSRSLDYQRDLGLLYCYANDVENVHDRKLKPADFAHNLLSDVDDVLHMLHYQSK